MPPSRRCWSSMFPPCHCERSEAIQKCIRGGSLDCFVATLLAMTLLPLRQEADHGIGEGVRLLDVGDVGGIENGEAGARNLAANELAGRNWRRHVMAAGDDQRRALDLG